MAGKRSALMQRSDGEYAVDTRRTSILVQIGSNDDPAVAMADRGNPRKTREGIVQRTRLQLVRGLPSKGGMQRPQLELILQLRGNETPCISGLCQPMHKHCGLILTECGAT